MNNIFEQLNITYILLGISLIASLLAFNKESLMEKWVNYPYQMEQDRSFYRLIMSGLIHGDYIHLIINFFVLFNFGPIVEIYFNQIFGNLASAYFGTLVFFGILIPNLINYFRQRSNPNFRSLGISGAVSAVIFTFILFEPFHHVLIYGIISCPSWLAGILYLAYSIYGDRAKKDNIDHLAHLSGAFTGILFMALTHPSVVRNLLPNI